MFFFFVCFIFPDRVVDEMNQTENFSKNEIQSLIIEDWVQTVLFYTQHRSVHEKRVGFSVLLLS